MDTCSWPRCRSTAINCAPAHPKDSSRTAPLCDAHWEKWHLTARNPAERAKLVKLVFGRKS